MPLEPKAQLVDPQGPIDVTGVNATGVTTATGGFVGNIQGSATGLASTTLNLTAGIITATRFIGDVTGTASSLNRGANITVGVMTATFVGDLLGNATGLTTTTNTQFTDVGLDFLKSDCYFIMEIGIRWFRYDRNMKSRGS